MHKPHDATGTEISTMDAYLVDDISIGMITAEMERPCHITLSTFDIDLRLFMTEFYDAENTYDIWYWYLDQSYTQANLPNNVVLHQLEKNHAKFWYIKDSSRAKLVVTSANLTYPMVHGCLQSYVSVMADKKEHVSEELARDYAAKLDKFFGIYKTRLDIALYSHIVDRLLYNIPGRVNGIERWLAQQTDLVVDTNNATLSYLPTVSKTVVVRTSVPASNKVIAYYGQDKASARTSVVSVPYSCSFHYKLYYTRKCALVSSNNFSYNHKNNYELGIILHERFSK